MNSIEELLKTQCPKGVESKPLGEVCEIYTGVQFNKRDMQESGKYPVINGGVNPSGYIEKYNELENTITISQGGASAGYINFITTKFWAGAHCYVVKPKQNLNILNRFLYFALKNNQERIMQLKLGAGIPGLSGKVLKKFQIPIPPLIVQKKIVSILDTFTELEAELEARKKQYAYYREKLLSFDYLDSITGGALVIWLWVRLALLLVVVVCKKAISSNLESPAYIMGRYTLTMALLPIKQKVLLVKAQQRNSKKQNMEI